MDLLAAWALFPAVLALVALGAGLLVERLAALRLPGVLLLPVGLAGLVVVARLVTSLEQTARFGLALALALALAGLVLGLGRLSSLRPERWTALAALAVFAVWGAPVFLSGEPTFAGYTLLPDTSHQFSLADLYARLGPDYGALAPSANRTSLSQYVSNAHPVAGQTLLGVLAPLGVLDLAWLYQPFLTFLGVNLALALSSLVAPWVPQRPLRALVSFVAATPVLVVAFALQGSVKEIGILVMFVLTAALVTLAIRAEWRSRALLPVVFSVVAGFGSLGPAAGAYVAPMLAVLGCVWAWRLVRRWPAIEALKGAAIAGLAVVLALPLLLQVSTAFAISSGLVSLTEDLGNLAAPLPPVEALGIWLSPDYRLLPPEGTLRLLTKALLGVEAVAFGLGLVWCIRRRAGGPLLLLGSAALAGTFLLARGSPYLDAKVLATVSSALVLVAMLGVVWLRQAGRALIAGLLAVPLVGGVLASNALAYRGAQLAPYDRYAELLDIDERLAGRGPVVNVEYDEFGKYFLRRADGLTQPESPHRFGPDTLDNKRLRPSEKTPLDLDSLKLSYLGSVRHIVVRRSPMGSRPPANFGRTFAGRYYEVWSRRQGTEGRVRTHLGLGPSILAPAAEPPCGRVRRLARRAAQDGGRLAFVARPRPIVLLPTDAPPPPWAEFEDFPGALVPTQPGRLRWVVRAGRSGDVRLWLEGSFGREVRVRLDGRDLGAVQNEQGNPGQYLPIGTARLGAGTHEVEVVVGGGTLRPGDKGAVAGLRHIGPLVLAPVADEARTVRELPPRRARELCGQRLDWVEVVGGRRP